jgi:hypothetical protein
MASPLLESALGRKKKSGFKRTSPLHVPVLPISPESSFASLARKRPFSQGPVSLSPINPPVTQQLLSLLSNGGSQPEEHEEVDSTSECGDSEYSVPPMKSPDNSLHLDPNFEENIEDTIGRIFGSFKSLTSDLENKYK